MNVDTHEYTQIHSCWVKYADEVDDEQQNLDWKWDEREVSNRNEHLNFRHDHEIHATKMSKRRSFSKVNESC